MAEHQFPLIRREEVAEGTMAFWFSTAGHDFTFEAGQNADYTLIDPPQTDAEGNMRTFSFASSPTHKGEFMIATRMRDTAFKNVLKTMPIGTPVKVLGPLGTMVLQEDATRPAVFLAGGIGITPFRSMVESATVTKQPHKIFLFYSNRTSNLTTFHNDLEAWAAANPNFKYYPTLTDEQPADWAYLTGYIDRAMLEAKLGDLSKPIFYIAGPTTMLNALREVLTKAGVSRDNIRSEEFTGY